MSNESKPKPNRLRPQGGGRYPKITEETALRIADRIASGLPMKYACALEDPAFPAQHFEASLERGGSGSRIALAYDKRVAEHMQRFLAIQNDPNTKLRGMPASVWVWERRFPQFFAPPKTTAPVSVTVNTLVGLGDDVLRRAASMVKRRETQVVTSHAATEIEDRKPQLQEPTNAATMAGNKPTEREN